jgi:hypothetical protein
MKAGQRAPFGSVIGSSGCRKHVSLQTD